MIVWIARKKVCQVYTFVGLDPLLHIISEFVTFSLANCSTKVE
jgi:hypothetical protein